MITFPHIIRLWFLVKVPTKSTRAGRKLGGPVKTRHCGLREKKRRWGLKHSWKDIPEKSQRTYLTGIRLALWQSWLYTWLYVKISITEYRIPVVLYMVIYIVEAHTVGQCHVIWACLHWGTPIYSYNRTTEEENHFKSLCHYINTT